MTTLLWTCIASHTIQDTYTIAGWYRCPGHLGGTTASPTRQARIVQCALSLKLSCPLLASDQPKTQGKTQ